jgi:hypothetical protein
MAGKQTKNSSAPTVIHAVIDRIEDDGMAVILVGDDEKTQIDLPISLLPENVEDGAHLQISITLDEKSRAVAQARIKQLRDDLENESNTQGQQNFKL